jgi:hypothetical protein
LHGWGVLLGREGARGAGWGEGGLWIAPIKPNQ